MRLFTLLFFAVLSAITFGQTAAKPAVAADFQKEALVFERSETAIRMHADGTGERVTHIWLRLQSEGAARQFGVLAFSYAASNETPHITLVRVHKPDGSTIETPVTDAIDMPAAVSREAPLYSDLKEKHLPVRSLATGDTLEYEVHVTIDKAQAPGQFWGAQHFTAPGTFIILAEGFTLEVPRDKYVQVWSPNHKPTITEHDGLRTYRWEQSQLVPAPKTNGQGDDAVTAPKDPDEDADGRKLPSVAWTTFHSWAEVGDWYRGLSLERAQPDDALRARAAEITKDAKTPDEQVRAIYTFVSTRTRYVGIDFGIGRYQPHAAADVLANNYGDCKDKDTLLEALLRAEGFHTAPALIGVGVTPVEAVPSPAVFNHVITTVDMPGGRIWLDSTPEVGPFRFLTSSIRDQLALVVPAAGPAALETTPAAPPYPMVARFEATGALDAEGKFTSHITASYRTDDEVLLRQTARSVGPAEWDKVSQYISSWTGFSGTTSHTSISNPEDLSSPIVFSYDYTRPSYGDWENRRIVPCFPALEFNALTSDHNPPAADIQLGAPRTLTAICRIRLPESYRTDLPDPVHVKTDFTTFDKTYRYDGKDVVIERTIVVLAKKLPKTEWRRYQTFSKAIGLDGEPWIQLIRTQAVPQQDRPTIARGKPQAETANQAAQGGARAGSDRVAVQGLPVDGSHSNSAEPANSELAPELIRSAWQQIQARDWSAAKATLEKVKAKDPGIQGLWSLYATLAAYQRNYAEAIADFKKELAARPDLGDVVLALAGVEAKSGDSAEARHTLQTYLISHPGSLKLSLNLAQMQSAARDYEGARKTLETAAHDNPDDRMVRVRLSDTLLALNRKDEAAAVAKSALDGTDDVEVLNDAGYALAETGLDLPYAEEVSRKSIAELEAKTAAITPAEVNSHAFAQSRLLIASWDTLGWILFREGKVEDALPLILAGWRNALAPEAGDHLGQVYEAMGKKEEALSSYRLAAASIEGENASPEVRERITQSVARLGGASATGSRYDGAQALQQTRTYSVARPAGVSGWGTFRLQINTAGVIASQQMSGDEKLAAISGKINAMKFPELVPPGSAAHLLRSAVVSCSMGSTCDVVLVPNSSLQTEQ